MTVGDSMRGQLGEIPGPGRDYLGCSVEGVLSLACHLRSSASAAEKLCLPVAFLLEALGPGWAHLLGSYMCQAPARLNIMPPPQNPVEDGLLVPLGK